MEANQTELEALREALDASRQALEEARSVPPQSEEDYSQVDALRQQVAELQEDLEVDTSQLILVRHNETAVS